MNQQEYIVQREEINNNITLTKDQKFALKRELWLDYISVERSGYNMVNINKIKPVFMKMNLI